MEAISDQDILDEGVAVWFRINADSACVSPLSLQIIGKNVCVCTETKQSDIITILSTSVSAGDDTANLTRLAGVTGWGALDDTQIRARACALLCDILQL